MNDKTIEELEETIKTLIETVQYYIDKCTRHEAELSRLERLSNG